MRQLYAAILCLLVSRSLPAAEISTLEFYLTKSPLVVVATVKQRPDWPASDSVRYRTQIDIDEVLHGTLNKTPREIIITRIPDTGGVPAEPIALMRLGRSLAPVL